MKRYDASPSALLELIVVLVVVVLAFAFVASIVH